VLKYFPILRERVSTRFGADFFNIFNRRHLGGDATNIDNSHPQIADPDHATELQWRSARRDLTTVH